MTPISLRQRRWLEIEARRWADAGLVEPLQAQTILDSYETTEAVVARRSQQTLFALLGLAILMCAIGLLLLIGYNWALIPRIGKAALILPAVTLTFAASAWMYVQGRTQLGELLAFAAMLVYGNAIWLLAQAFHVSGGHPDGAFWWMAGALLAAWMLQSRAIAIQAVLLLATWTGLETIGFSNANYLFLPCAAAVLWLAYRLESPVLATLTVVALHLWLLFAGINAWSAGVEALVLIALAGCACYAAAASGHGSGAMARAVSTTGLTTAGAALALLTLTFLWSGPIFFTVLTARWASAITAFILLAITAMAVLTSSTRQRDSFVVALAALLAAHLIGGAAYYGGWARATPIGTDAPLLSLAPAWGHVIFFTVLAAAFAIWLLVRGVRSESGRSFACGTVMMVLLVLIRWIDLAGDMIGSALLLFAGAGVVFGTAWIWRRQQIGQSPEVGHA